MKENTATAPLLKALKKAYPEAYCSLDHHSPFELLMATILSAQCTDARVNMVTPAVFARYPTPEDLAEANPAELEELIHSTGFFRNKAKSLLGMANALVEPDKVGAPEALFPLEVDFCRGCGLLQVNETIRADGMRARKSRAS